MHGVPERIRGDNGPEFISAAIELGYRRWYRGAVYRTWFTVAEPCVREFQKQAARRFPESGRVA